MSQTSTTTSAETCEPGVGGRPAFPKRAVVTGGMPYGNKNLHFGHVSGVFVPADFYARFLRDRIGRENVVFVSGTDCYGSPIMEGFRKKVENEGYTGTIEDYVGANHEAQAKALDAYEISCDLFAGSALEPAASFHRELTAAVEERLHEKGVLSLRSTKQFYDPQAGQFLNGRQVMGFCPVRGCKSEKAYADECDLGHQFEPEELIKPVSQLTGCTPELRPVDNWYFDLPAGHDFIAGEVERQKADPRVRPVVTSTVAEWLLPPVIYIQNTFREAYDAIAATLPPHTLGGDPKASSFDITFGSWKDRDDARDALAAAGVRFRTGKTLLPFRITGNIEWGVPTPEMDGVTGLTTWCWPESLWAPISFTQTVLAQDAERGGARYSSDDWRDWWCSEEAEQFQFIGQDNIYFYCVAQPALWEALDWGLHQSIPVANYHILFMGKKASSSGAVKPPMALDLLERYTPEQLRAHWLSLGLGDKPVSFSPKPWDPDEKVREDPRAADPALKESALLTNVFNRLARSCFYGCAKTCGLHLPAGKPAPEVEEACRAALLAYEQRMYVLDFPGALRVAEDFIRDANKRWSDASKAAKNAGAAAEATGAEGEGQPEEDAVAMEAALRDAFAALRTAALLMHPAVPGGCEMICDYFQIDPAVFFSWENAFCDLDGLVERAGGVPGEHLVRELPPRTDFFCKHPSQF